MELLQRCDMLLFPGTDLSLLSEQLAQSLHPQSGGGGGRKQLFSVAFAQKLKGFSASNKLVSAVRLRKVNRLHVQLAVSRRC